MDMSEANKATILVYKIKALIRWARYSLRFGVSYHRYTDEQIQSAEGFDHPLGWYEARGNTIAFRGDNGEIEFLW